MISRVADDCFWFGRYVERAESTARLLGVTRQLVFDAELTPAQCWQPLVIVAGEYPSIVASLGAPAAGNGEVVQKHMTWRLENHVSIRSSVAAAREIGRTMRDVLSHEVWEEINELYLWLTGEEGERGYQGHREEFYREVRRRTQLCLGLVRSTMLHEEPMRFLWLGVMLERVGQTARILDMHHHTLSGERPHRVVELSLWLSLLRAVSGFEAFMKLNRGSVRRSAVTSFLVFEGKFPRSLRYCLRSALGVMKQIWPAGGSAGARSVGEMTALCEWLDGVEPSLRDLSMHDLLTGVVDRTTEVCSTLQREMLGPPTSATTVVTQTQAQ